MKTMSVKARAERFAARIRKNRARGGRTGGFTLVELIVVIAILAVLAGVGTVAYSGYVKKANKTVDQQMVAEIVYSIELAAISDPANFPSDASLYLSSAPAQVTGPDSAGLADILTDAYGSGFANQLTLKYTQWGLGETVSTCAKSLNTTLNNLGARLSYTDNVDELWDEVEEILTGLESTATMISVYGGDAGLMAAAAGYTVSDSAISQEDFAALWSDLTTGFNGLGTDYNSSADKNAETLNPMLAKSAAIKARNYAFGNWLAAHYPDLSTVATGIQDAGTGMTVGGVAVPMNFVDKMTQGNPPFSGLTRDQWSQFNTALREYFGASTTFNTDNAVPIQINSSAADPTTTQAYADALGYYTLMLAVDGSTSETGSMGNDEYKETMAAAVHNVGVLLNDPTALAAVEDGIVTISVKKAEDGTITYYITPSSIYVGNANAQSGVGNSTAQVNSNVTVIVELDGENVTFTPNGMLVLKNGSTGTISYDFGTNYVNTIIKPEVDQYNAEHPESPMSLEDGKAAFLAMIAVNLSSSDTGVVTVSGNTVAAVGTGSATIDAEDGSFSVSVTVIE